MNFFQYTATAVTVTFTLGIGPAFGACVTGVGDQFTPDEMEDFARTADRQDIRHGTMWDPDNDLFNNGPLPEVLVGRFGAVSDAPERCEAQHLEVVGQHPGETVTTGIYCGRASGTASVQTVGVPGEIPVCNWN